MIFLIQILCVIYKRMDNKQANINMQQKCVQKHISNSIQDINNENNRQGNPQQQQKHTPKQTLIGDTQKIDKLKAKILKLQAQNKRLKSRIADFQPHKQKVLRLPNIKKINNLFSTYKTKKIALKICYLGFTYDGMAYQQDIDNTVESYLFKAMYTLSLISTQTPGADYTRAGRTDKGVSAMGNVISLRLRSNQKIENQIQCSNNQQIKSIPYASMLNAILPEDIRILAAQQVSDEFNSRYWCTRRSYKYFFAKNNLNIQIMKEAIKYFEGTHNFINFCKINLANTVNFERTIFSAQIHQSDVCQLYQNDSNQIFYFHYIGNSFLWHQIRFMSSILFLIGSGKQKPQIIKQLLDTDKYPRKPNYPMAPQYPLILQDCEYKEVELIPDKETVFAFQKTLNQIIIKKSVQKTLIINCIKMAQRDLISSGKISMEIYAEQYRNKVKQKNIQTKRLQMHKSSGRSLDQAVSSLKGKRKQLFEKKKQKQEEYEQRVRIQKQKKQ